jgi:hypothetical protein
MADLASAGELLRTVFVRFNPDVYRDSEGKKRVIPLQKRLEKLKEEIDYWLDPDRGQDKFLTVVYLYYDGSEIREMSFIEVWIKYVDDIAR